MTDAELLHRYAVSGAQDAFSLLVNRHIQLVYSAARRQLGEANLAEDATQAVFLVLARRAAALSPQTVLPAWLLTTTRHVCRDAQKSARRRHLHEQKAAAMTPNTSSNEPEADYSAMTPHLDDALAALPTTDRAAIVLRFMQAMPLKDVGAALGVSEAAAQKRLARALAKLRHFFSRRNITLSITVIPLALVWHGTPTYAAPPALAALITTSVTTGTVTPTVAALAKSTLHAIFWPAAKIAVVVSIIVAAVGLSAMTLQRAPLAPPPLVAVVSPPPPTSVPATAPILSSALPTTTQPGVIPRFAEFHSFQLHSPEGDELAYDSAKGTYEASSDSGRHVLQFDDGAYHYRWLDSPTRVGRSKSVGFASATVVEALNGIKENYRNLAPLTRDPAHDKTIDTIPAKAFHVAATPPDQPEMILWKDPQDRVISFASPVAPGIELAGVRYDRPVSPALLALPKGAKVIDTDAWLEEHCPLKSAVAQKEANRQIVAVHFVEQTREGIILVCLSSRLTDDSIRELGWNHRRLSDFCQEPGVDWARPDRPLPYSAVRLAAARGATWVTTWFALVPKGSEPLANPLAIRINLIVGYAEVNDWLKSHGGSQINSLNFSLAPTVPVHPRSYLDLADVLYTDAESLDPVLNWFMLAHRVGNPNSNSDNDPPSKTYTRQNYLDDLRQSLQAGPP